MRRELSGVHYKSLRLNYLKPARLLEPKEAENVCRRGEQSPGLCQEDILFLLAQPVFKRLSLFKQRVHNHHSRLLHRDNRSVASPQNIYQGLQALNLGGIERY